jgi:ribosomal protein S9
MASGWDLPGPFNYVGSRGADGIANCKFLSIVTAAKSTILREEKMENINLTLNLTVAQVNVILKYLGGGVFAEVEGVINAIRRATAHNSPDAGRRASTARVVCTAGNGRKTL